MNAPSMNRKIGIKTDTRPHAVVIGSGFGGLAAAIRLGAKGYRVTVVEKQMIPGGRAGVFKINGFTFDAGPTIVTAPFLFEELWTLCGKRMSDHIDLRALTPCYQIRFADGETFNTYSDEKQMLAEVGRLSPGDVAGYKRFITESRKCYEAGFERLTGRAFNRFSAMIRSLPDLIMRRADRSTYQSASKFVKNEKLRIALSFHPLFLGGNPFRANSIFTLISYLERRWGVHYAMGGTHSLVQGLADLIVGQGNIIRLNSEVAAIDIENGVAKGVTLKSGETIDADIVVSNADSAWTYKHLISSSHRKRWTDKRIDRGDYSMSLIVWYFGTNHRFEDIEHHTIMMGPRYKGLLTDIFDRKILAEDFSLYLHRPTKTDTGIAPPGCDAFYVLSPVPNLDGNVDWPTVSEPYRKKIEQFLDATIMPGLCDSIVASKVITPHYFHDELLSVKGAAFGLEPKISQIAYFKPHNTSEDIANLYLVGAGTHPGAGMPGVISSAKILEELVPDAKTLIRTSTRRTVNTL